MHPVPGTDDGQHNPDFDPEIMAHQPDGSPWVWFSGAKHTDPLQGPSYHLSKTKDAATGERWRRLQAFVDSTPVQHTVHSDAYRDINDSWETDERGFIAEDEEAACGLQGDTDFWAKKGISLTIEGPDGAASALGPVPGNIHVVSYYQGGPQHDATAALGWWNRLFSGQMQGIEHDLILTNTTSESVGGQWQVEGGCHGKCFDTWKDSVYLKAMVAAMQMTDELVHSEPCQCRELTGHCAAYSFNSYQFGCVRNQRFRNGGNGTHWPYGGGWILYIPLWNVSAIGLRTSLD